MRQNFTYLYPICTYHNAGPTSSAISMPDQIIKLDFFSFPPELPRMEKWIKFFSLGEEGIESGSKYIVLQFRLGMLCFYVDFTSSVNSPLPFTCKWFTFDLLLKWIFNSILFALSFVLLLFLNIFVSEAMSESGCFELKVQISTISTELSLPVT